MKYSAKQKMPTGKFCRYDNWYINNRNDVMIEWIQGISYVFAIKVEPKININIEHTAPSSIREKLHKDRNSDESCLKIIKAKEAVLERL